MLHLDSKEAIKQSIDYLNFLRNKAGLWGLTNNNFLNKSAFNHSKYLVINNLYGHDENECYSGFTGITPTDRGEYVGYNGFVMENISYGERNVQESIDKLFSAIYHRFGFLGFTIDEIGMSACFSENFSNERVFVYNMGNSLIRQACENAPYDLSEGSYYTNICIDKNIKIPYSLYNNAYNSLLERAPKYVIWPYRSSYNIPPVFYEETPDPLPDCSVTGYPVSIQFNENKVDKRTFQFLDFKLYDSENNVVNSRLLDSLKDPNHYFTEYEFALMPLERLNWGEEYTVIVKYKENNISKIIKWNFITRLLKYPYIVINDYISTVNIISGKEYALYLKPFNCNDYFTRYEYSYKSNIKSVNIDMIDMNTLYLKIVANKRSIVTIKFSNNITVNVLISSSDNVVNKIKLAKSKE